MAANTGGVLTRFPLILIALKWKKKGQDQKSFLYFTVYTKSYTLLSLLILNTEGGIIIPIVGN